jgi:hypothetical protein
MPVPFPGSGTASEDSSEEKSLPTSAKKPAEAQKEQIARSKEMVTARFDVGIPEPCPRIAAV